jgi:hypothetical protein
MLLRIVRRSSQICRMKRFVGIPLVRVVPAAQNLKFELPFACSISRFCILLVFRA